MTGLPGATAAAAARTLACALGLSLVSTAVPALDGDDMDQYCIAALAAEYAACLGYVRAIMDVLRLDPVRGFEACIPRTATPEDAVAVVRDYLRRNPGAGAFQAPPVIAAALAEAFPCKGQ